MKSTKYMFIHRFLFLYFIFYFFQANVHVSYSGKKFFLDMVDSFSKSRLTKKLFSCGAEVSSFLNKNVQFVVTECNKPLIYKTGLSEFSRGGLMMSKAKGKSSGTSNIKKMAALWGLTILSYDDIIFNLQDSCSNITKKANFKEVKLGHSSITKLRPPFIKIEGRNRKYRPQFKEFSRFPVLNFESTLGSCPFDDNEQGHWPGGGKG